MYEPVQPRSGKARLNLLNPMSLLARRRTSQAIPQLKSESLTSQRTNDFSATFDPRIRGTVVHDFSAPRGPRRNVSYNDVAAAKDANIQSSYQRSPNPQYVEANADENSTGPWSGGNHTPVFTENFEEQQYPAAGPHVRRASDLSDLPLPKPPYAKGASKPVDQSSMSKGNEAPQQQLQPSRKISDRKPVNEVGPPVPPKIEGEVPQPRRVSIDPAATPPKTTKNSKKGPSRNASGVSAKDDAISGLPKPMKSTSSRFSFDMIGAAEQERLLEDRHRQRALERKNEKRDDPYDEDEEDFDYNDMMDDDSLEERIPGVNADLDEGDDDLEGLLDDDDGLEEPILGVNADSEEEHDGALHDNQKMAGFTFQQSALASPMSPYTPGMVSTPRDANGEVIGFAFTKDSPYVPTVQDSIISPLISPNAIVTSMGTNLQGLGLQNIEMSNPEEVEEESSPADIPPFPQASGIDDDDLYFDDGIIDDLEDVEEPVEFDESVFDNIDTDQYGRPVKSFSSLPTLYSPPTLATDQSPSFNKIPETGEKNPRSPDVVDSAVSPGTIPPPGALAPKPSVIGHANSTIAPSPNLTQDTLAAYQSALAAAAHAAAANGKFSRRDSTTPDAFSPSFQDDPHPGLIEDSSQTSHYEPFSPAYEFEDDFDYDDALEDDAIIAAANAEALANDCDGFYGQEFGFYSAPAASAAEYANGGYFGPRGVEGINRSISGRVASREPNLTPITERSEYSNRNSFMSLSMHGPGSVVSPGLAQLAGMLNSQDYEGDMSLNALLKLRRGAWGGSQASLHSSTGSPRSAGPEDMSPAGGLPPWAQGNANFPQDSSRRHRRQNSGYSIGALSEESNSGVQSKDGSPPRSPTLTLASRAPLVPPESSNLGFRREDDREAHSASPKEETKDEKFREHRYTGSAESISYSKEDDPSSPTGERWVLERRRTAESGEVITGREVVSGGRI
jgi:hypothetical protein